MLPLVSCVAATEHTHTHTPKTYQSLGVKHYTWSSLASSRDENKTWHEHLCLRATVAHCSPTVAPSLPYHTYMWQGEFSSSQDTYNGISHRMFWCNGNDCICMQPHIRAMDPIASHSAWDHRWSASRRSNGCGLGTSIACARESPHKGDWWRSQYL